MRYWMDWRSWRWVEREVEDGNQSVARKRVRMRVGCRRALIDIGQHQYKRKVKITAHEVSCRTETSSVIKAAPSVRYRRFISRDSLSDLAHG